MGSQVLLKVVPNVEALKGFPNLEALKTFRDFGGLEMVPEILKAGEGFRILRVLRH
jgi:hypothetical protein